LVRRYIKALGGGHATLIRASDEARAVTSAFHPEPEAVVMLSRRVKEKFDPAGIFNPGKMG
jgi:glycolate oxidase FAD binding subunit